MATPSLTRVYIAGLTLLATLTVAGCAPEAGENEVRAYVDEVIPLLRQGIKADGPQWEQQRDSALEELYQQSTVEETYDELNTLAVQAGGKHSSFITPGQARDWETTSESVQLPEVTSDGRIGTMTLPAFNSSDPELEQQYLDAALDGLQEERRDTSCGWIVDLRDNAGGNMFPMLGAAAPFLDDGPVLKLQAKSSASEVDVAHGRLVDSPSASEAQEGFVLDTPVAVLTSSATSSAAEAVVIAFSGQDGARSFGGRTAGNTTGNQVFELSDGALLVLTTSYMVDRDEIVYDGPIEPDVLINPRAGTDPRAAAEAWLEEQCVAL